MKQTIYMDYNATAPLRDEAREAMLAALSDVGNPSSVHAQGRLQRKRIEDARESIKTALNAPDYDVIFTSGGTESNALALCQKSWGSVLVSAIEHPCVLQSRADVQTIAVDENGLINLKDLEKRLEKSGPNTLVSIMAANNETGVVQPLAKISKLVHEFGAVFHSDAVQAFGKIPLDMAEVDADLVSLSAHKIGGPQGVGALLRKRDFPLEALIFGGGQEYSLRPGTHNVAAIAGFGAVAKEMTDFDRNLRDDLEKGLENLGADIKIMSQNATRTPNTSCFVLPGMSSEKQVMALDLQGFMVSAGSACSSGKVKASHVLKAMGLSDEEAGSAIRISLGWKTTRDEIRSFLQAYETIVRRAEEKKKRRSDAA